MSCVPGVQYVPNQIYGNDSPNLRGVCSGQGTCNIICICNDGWTSRTDFFGETFTDCPTFIVGIQIEYALLLALSLASVYFQLPGLKKRYAEYDAARQKAIAKGKKYGIVNNRAALTMVIWHSVGTTSIIATCILRIAFPEERIGVTVPITFFFMTAKNAFYICSLLYQPYLFKVLLKGDAMNDTKGQARFLHFINVTSGIGCALSVLGSFAPFVSIADRTLAAETFILYYVLSGLGLYYNAAIAVAIFFKAEKLLSQSYEATKDDRVLKMKAKMKGFQLSVVKSASVFGSLYMLCLLWPFWWNLHDYFHAITWVALIKVSNDIALGTLERGSNKKGSTVGSPGTLARTGTETGTAQEEKSYSV